MSRIFLAHPDAVRVIRILTFAPTGEKAILSKRIAVEVLRESGDTDMDIWQILWLEDPQLGNTDEVVFGLWCGQVTIPRKNLLHGVFSHGWPGSISRVF